MNSDPKLSVIIVSYNVREFLYQCLKSLQRAVKDIPAEIYVVDNASVDGSARMVSREFPDIDLISSEKNLGFARANNLAIRKATGEYIVLLNPDTIVQEDTFSKLIHFADNHEDAGALGCKILNPDGSFSVDSRHSIPSPLTALWKLLGLNRIFPKSRIFGRYNLTYLDPDDSYPVDAISGSFMMIRRSVITQLGGLDEDYFMYCEDIDYCYRITQSGWKIYYFAGTNIIHYKGESTKKNNLDYVINFNRSLYLFYKKHFHSHYFSLFRWVILLGVMGRGAIIYLRNFLRHHFALLSDLFLLNLFYLVTFYVRFELKSGFTFEDFVNQYIYINLVSSFIYTGSAYFLELYGKYKLSLVQVFKTNLITFFMVAAITFFFNQFAFSRIVVVIASLLSGISMISWRLVMRALGSRSGSTFSKSFFQRRTVLVGAGEETELLVKKIQANVQSGKLLVGIISESGQETATKIGSVPVVSDLANLKEYIRLEKIDEVIFSTHRLTYKSIIETISDVNNPRVDFRIVPENLEVIIGKSSIEPIMDYQLVEIDYPLGKTFNRLTKRIFDLILSGFLIIVTAPVWIIAGLTRSAHKASYEVSGPNNRSAKVMQIHRPINEGILNKILLLPAILKGTISFVGAPLTATGDKKSSVLYKAGLTGLTQIRMSGSGETDSGIYEMYYAKNQSFWLDMEIIIKSLFR